MASGCVRSYNQAEMANQSSRNRSNRSNQTDFTLDCSDANDSIRSCKGYKAVADFLFDFLNYYIYVDVCNCDKALAKVIVRQLNAQKFK